MRNIRMSLKGFWKAARAGFMTQLVVISALVFTTEMCTLIHNPITTVIFLITPFTLGLMFVCFTLSPFVSSTINTYRLSRHAIEIPTPNEIKALARAMGINRKFKVKIVPNLFNAFATRSTIGLGTKLLDVTNIDEGRSVVAHELDHLKRANQILLVRILSILPVLIVSIGLSNSTVVTLPWVSAETIGIVGTITIYLAIFAYSLLATMPSNWIFELRADKTAKTFAGEQSTIEMLRKLDKKGNPNENSITHPSINSRIKQLQSENNHRNIISNLSSNIVSSIKGMKHAFNVY